MKCGTVENTFINMMIGSAQAGSDRKRMVMPKCCCRYCVTRPLLLNSHMKIIVIAADDVSVGRNNKVTKPRLNFTRPLRMQAKVKATAVCSGTTMTT